jgi:hypothetical protein
MSHRLFVAHDRLFVAHDRLFVAHRGRLMSNWLLGADLLGA